MNFKTNYFEISRKVNSDKINIQSACAAVGLCPYIQDAWLTDKGGVMVMDLYKMTAKQMLILYDDINDKQNILAHIITLVDKFKNFSIVKLHVKSLNKFNKIIFSVVFSMIKFKINLFHRFIQSLRHIVIH